MRRMNVSDLARRLRTTPQELLAKLPELGFDIGARAIKIDEAMGEKIAKKWMEHDRQQGIRDSRSSRRRDELKARNRVN